jgi:hypothetical protein
MDLKVVQASDGRKEEIVLLWKGEIKVQLFLAVPNFIYVRIEEKQDKI